MVSYRAVLGGLCTASQNCPKVADFFAGAGGISLGFESAGFDTVGFESDAQAANTSANAIQSPSRRRLIFVRCFRIPWLRDK